MGPSRVVSTSLALVALGASFAHPSRAQLNSAAPADATSGARRFANFSAPAPAPTQALPIIVTYEMKRRREAEVASARDPKGFWVRQVTARLEESKPAASLGLQKPATALVTFVVDRGGRIASKAIARSSGVAAVDAQALAMLDRAQPFPPMPATMPDVDLSFSLPLRFR